MEASETRANSTIGIDGGMIGPITAVAAVSAAAKLGAYLPSFVIMFCIILPVPAASAMAEPDMPAKMTLWRMLTWASPPRKRPTKASQKRSRRSVMEPMFHSSAARLNRGPARMMTLVYMPLVYGWESVGAGRRLSERLDP